MGLDTTHNAWHGSYGGFAEFRRQIARRLLNIDLEEMEGFSGSRSWEPFVKADIYPLLNHSDCDGKLSVRDCKKVARALKGMNLVGTEEWIQRAVKQFIKGCEDAIERKEPIEFH